MSRRIIPLKSRIRYEGRVQTFDRRAKQDAALEKIPDPIWRIVGVVLRSRMKDAASAQKTAQPEQK